MRSKPSYAPHRTQRSQVGLSAGFLCYGYIMKQWLIAGLGNPGREFEGTRHNLGAEFLQAWASQSGAASKAQCLLPSLFMNESGSSVKHALGYYKMAPDQLVVIHDDMELPLGEAALVEGGSARGHNGVRSVEAALGTAEFWRLRLGIGRPPEGIEARDFVLGRFRKEERVAVDKMILGAGAKLDGILVR